MTYLPLDQDFIFLAAVIDWHSWFMHSWRLSNTQDDRFCLKALDVTLEGGRPKIFNTDQGVQSQARAVAGRLKAEGIAVSMG